jgi:predicted nucleic acid-binding protein
MRLAYLDTAYHVALIDTRDALRDAALTIGELLRREGVRFVTSEAVLIEFLTYLSAHGEWIRDAAVRYVEELRSDPLVTIIPQTPALFDASFDLYRRRRDKTFSMVDCIGMVICRQQNITDVLTADNDFAQEGFTLLLS